MPKQQKMKRSGESAGMSKSPEKKKSKNDRSSEFDAETDQLTKALQVEDRQLWVPPQTLAEQSEFFKVTAACRD